MCPSGKLLRHNHKGKAIAAMTTAVPDPHGASHVNRLCRCCSKLIGSFLMLHTAADLLGLLQSHSGFCQCLSLSNHYNALEQSPCLLAEILGKAVAAPCLGSLQVQQIGMHCNR